MWGFWYKIYHHTSLLFSPDPTTLLSSRRLVLCVPTKPEREVRRAHFQGLQLHMIYRGLLFLGVVFRVRRKSWATVFVLLLLCVCVCVCVLYSVLDVAYIFSFLPWCGTLSWLKALIAFMLPVRDLILCGMSCHKLCSCCVLQLSPGE